MGKALQKMKAFGLLALLVVAATCQQFHNHVQRVFKAFDEVRSAIEGRQRQNIILESVKKLENSVREVRGVIPATVNELRDLGYSGSSCDDSIRKLEFLAKTIVSNAEKQRYNLIVEDRTPLYNAASKVNTTCSSLERSIETTFRSNQNSAKCKEVFANIQKAYIDATRDNTPITPEIDRKFQIAILNACCKVTK
eukprot:TRINITY_DN41_c0_g3_i2.p1 TRINITY_DN41_c0_g3~~TRINITY_DN41_c0_g3_i2.p1  ORF type:complete len:195 (-),score=60.12 TRINITY_DN41_c0_g3_i2:174-758(-)